MVKIIQEMGFIIHPVKSALSPVQRYIFIDFFFLFIKHDYCAHTRQKNKKKIALEQLNSPIPPNVVWAIGIDIAFIYIGVELGPLHYRDLESDKIRGWN